MISQEDFTKLKYHTLKHFWGYDSFRDSQEEIIDTLISGKDILALLPTGGGKSLCYQLPALFLEGTCLVISPLLALMKDQVTQLKQRGIEAEYLSSELDEFEAEIIYENCKEGIIKILYVSPERLSNNVFLENIKEIKISFIAVDEAHCISEWGQDFRPSYQNIKNFRFDFPKIPCIALTATATPLVVKDILQKLELRSSKVFQKSFKRENIKIFSDKISDKYQRILDLLRYNNHSGIIYTRTRKDAEELAQFLQKSGIENVDYFHAGLTAREKHQKQNLWISSSNRVLISTNAFGMGIDKENVRFVIHLSPSISIENYYQEIGRAGRDGALSFAFMFWNEQEVSNFDQILKNQIPNKTEFVRIITYLYSLFQIAENDLTESTFQLHLQNLKNVSKCSGAKIKNILNFLHNQEIIYLNNYKSPSTLKLKILPEELDLLAKKDAYFIELLLRNLPGINTQKILFTESALGQKIQTDAELIKIRLRELKQNDYVEYIDGSLSSIKFLKHRDDRAIAGKYWNLFEQIQKNKIKKWEEMKFFTQNNEYCKMKLILSYFGEKNTKNCGKCSVCEKRDKGSNNIVEELLQILEKQPSTVDQICVQLSFFRREKILENLILLLDSGKIKMLDFRTYTIS